MQAILTSQDYPFMAQPQKDFPDPTTHFPSPIPEHLSPTDLRPRVTARKAQWTDAETNTLLYGIHKHGLGRWRVILQDPVLSRCFHATRTEHSLKDRYRALCKARDALGLAGNAAPVQRRRRRKWTAEEDAAALRGFEVHGARWTAIAEKSDVLRRNARTGTDVRDRLRNKYPTLYRRAHRVVKRKVRAVIAGEAGAPVTTQHASSVAMHPSSHALFTPEQQQQQQQQQQSVFAAGTHSPTMVWDHGLLPSIPTDPAMHEPPMRYHHPHHQITTTSSSPSLTHYLPSPSGTSSDLTLTLPPLSYLPTPPPAHIPLPTPPSSTFSVRTHFDTTAPPAAPQFDTAFLANHSDVNMAGSPTYLDSVHDAAFPIFVQQHTQDANYFNPTIMVQTPTTAFEFDPRGYLPTIPEIEFDTHTPQRQ